MSTLLEHPTPASPASAGVVNACEQLLSRFDKLHELLLLERQALVADATEELQETLALKSQLCNEIALQQTAFLADPQRSQCAPERIAALREAAARCKTQNAINGRIAHRARQTVSALMGIVNGSDQQALYASSGNTATRPPGPPGHRLASA